MTSRRQEPWCSMALSQPLRCNVAEEEMMRLSARNQLVGTIVSIALGAVMAEVVVEVGGGQQIVSAITRGAVEQLGLREGQAVVAVIKSTEVMIGVAEDGE